MPDWRAERGTEKGAGVPIMTTLSPVRCPNCHQKLAERLQGEAEFTCRRCKSIIRVSDGTVVALKVL